MYFDIDAHRDCFKTNENEAYFRHGQTNSVGGQDNAIQLASQNNGKTLEMCMLDNRDELEKAGVIFDERPDGYRISYNGSMDEQNKFWEDCSKSFANQASGNVHVIEGSDIRPNGQTEAEYPSVYNKIEHPALEQNPNVTGITHIDPSNGKTTGYEPLEHKSTSQSATSEYADIASPNIASINGGGANAPPEKGPRDIDVNDVILASPPTTAVNTKEDDSRDIDLNTDLGINTTNSNNSSITNAMSGGMQ